MQTTRRITQDHVSIRNLEEARRKREQLLEFIDTYGTRERWSPSREDMSAAIGQSLRTINSHLAILKQEGRIELCPGRGVRIAR